MTKLRQAFAWAHVQKDAPPRLARADKELGEANGDNRRLLQRRFGLLKTCTLAVTILIKAQGTCLSR